MRRVLSAFMVFTLALLGASRVAANEPHDLPNAFMASLLQGKIGEAVDQYMATNPVLAEKKQQIQAVKSAIEGAFQIFGQRLAPRLLQSMIWSFPPAICLHHKAHQWPADVGILCIQGQ